MRTPRVMSTRLLAPAAPTQSRCPMATSMTSGVLGMPGRTLPANPKHITNSASDKPMTCSTVMVKTSSNVPAAQKRWDHEPVRGNTTCLDSRLHAVRTGLSRDSEQLPFFAQRRQRLLEIRRPPRFEAHPLAGVRVFERQFVRVKQLAWRGVAGQFGQVFVLAVAIGGVTHDWKAEVFEVHANLVSATGVQERLDHRGLAQSFQDVEARPGVAPAAVGHGHALALCWVPRDSRAHLALLRRDPSADNRVINLFHSATGELRGKRQMGGVVFGDDQAAARFLVEPMHDARTRHAANAAELARAMVEQPIDERAVLVSG